MSQDKILVKAEVHGDVLFALVRDYVMAKHLSKSKLQEMLASPDHKFITRIEVKDKGDHTLSGITTIVEISIPKRPAKATNGEG